MKRRQFLAHSLPVFVAPQIITTAASAASVHRLAFRPAAFDVTSNAALIWFCAQTDTKMRVQVTLVDNKKQIKPMLSAPAQLNGANGFMAVAVFDQLIPNTRYRYIVCNEDGQPLNSSEFIQGGFKTAPSHADGFTFAFSGDTHARFKPFHMFDLIESKQPDFFVHLGDTVYADSPRNRFEPLLAYYREKHREIRDDKNLQNFLTKVPCVATLDDHEIFNDCDGTHPGTRAGLQAFCEFWPNVNRIKGPFNKVYRQFSWGTLADFFVLDLRQYRRNGETLTGSAQMQWLKRELKRSKAPFKFIASSVPFHSSGKDKWGGFDDDRNELKKFIEHEPIRTVIFLAADIHAARDYSKPRESMYEFMVGPIGAPPLSEKFSSFAMNEEDRKKFIITDQSNFGLMRVSMENGKPTAALKVIDDAGRVRYERKIVV